MEPNYHFGVEIEMIAKPHKVRHALHTLHALYYSKLAASLRKRQLKAAADKLDDSYRKHPEHYDKWWITKDGSLKLNDQENATLIPIEAVSPIFSIRSTWESDIDVFWTAMGAVFHQPERSPLCGSHIHVSKGADMRFTLNELKAIAFGIIAYETSIINMLMGERTDNKYCRRNSERSNVLGACKSIATVADVISAAHDTNALVTVMQNNRYVLWNFQNTLPNGSNTIEFRGGRFLRGKVRTKRWIAFAVSLIHWLLVQRHIRNPSRVPEYSSEAFYAVIKRTAGTLSLGHLLPVSYKQLNETAR